MTQTKNRNPKGERRLLKKSRTSAQEIDQTGWRHELQAAKIRFDDEAKEIFLQEFAKSDRLHTSAQMAGVCVQTVRNHIDNDPEFAEAVLEAKEAYRDRVRRTVQHVAIDGVREPIMGGKYKDEVVGEKTVYATNILAMEMRKTDPDYRDKQDIDVNVRGGVLVVPATMSEQDWEDKNSPKTIDSTAQEIPDKKKGS